MDSSNNPETIYIRINQLGYLPGESKIAVAFSHAAIKEKFHLISVDSKSNAAVLKPKRSKSKGWGTFNYYYEIDFSQIVLPGKYILQGEKSKSKSQSIIISSKAYQSVMEGL
jgi:hypothetical protein